MKKSSVKKILSYSAIVGLAVLSRLIPHAPNFAPIGGLALFSGANFNKKWAWLIPLTAMFFSDIFLGFSSVTPYVYLSFLIIALIGNLLKNIKWQSLTAASLISSVLFFLITNFGVWAASSMYQKNITGLMQCFAFGVPFFRNTLISDLFYTFTFFYGYRFLSEYFFGKITFSPKQAK